MVDKKKEIINTCLQTFVDNGLIEISMRDLGAACDMDAAGIYYYFKGKDELVVACAEEATVRIEEELFGTALADIDDPEKLVKDLDEKAVTMRPLMQFFISVCVSQKYSGQLKEVRYRQGDRYRYYIRKIADKLGCDYNDVAPLVYIVSNTMFSYMIFDPENFSAPQLRTVYDALNDFLKKRDLDKQ